MMVDFLLDKGLEPSYRKLFILDIILEVFLLKHSFYLSYFQYPSVLCKYYHLSLLCPDSHHTILAFPSITFYLKRLPESLSLL